MYFSCLYKGAAVPLPPLYGHFLQVNLVNGTNQLHIDIDCMSVGSGGQQKKIIIARKALRENYMLRLQLQLLSKYEQIAKSLPLPSDFQCFGLVLPPFVVIAVVVVVDLLYATPFELFFLFILTCSPLRSILELLIPSIPLSLPILLLMWDGGRQEAT